MKKKQVLAFLLCGTLTFGAVSPVMAAESVAPVEKTTEIKLQENQTVETEAQKQEPEKSKENQEVKPETSKPETAAPQETKPETPKAEDVVKPETKPETSKPEETKPQEKQSTEPETPKTEIPKQEMPEAPLQDIKTMSQNLKELVNQVEKFYSEMSEEGKESISEVTGSSVDVPATIAKLKTAVSEETLKTLVEQVKPEEVTAFLDAYEEKFVSTIDELKKILKDAEDFATNYEGYLNENLMILCRQLASILNIDPELYMDDYLAKIQEYYDKAITLVPNGSNYEEIIKFFDEAMAYVNEQGKHLNPAVLKDGIQAGLAFAEFFKNAPASMAGEQAFSSGGGETYTYQELADEIAPIVASAGQELLDAYNNSKLSYSDLSTYNTYYYENLVNAYQSVSTAILKEVSKRVAGAETMGYTGAEKDAYEAALQEYHSVFSGKNYSALSGAVSKLQKAADDYALAAETYAKEEGKKQLADLKEQLVKIQYEVERYSEHYQEAYLTEVKDMITKINNANLDNMSGTEIIQLITDGKAVIAKQASSYSKDLTDLVANANSMVTNAQAWWGYLPEDLKGKAPYKEAIDMTNTLTAALQSSNGLYDLDKLTATYEKFAADYAKADGKMQTAAKAVAQYVLEQAENVYTEEAKKEHTESVLKDFSNTIENLKQGIEKWDFNNTRSAVEAVKTAENTLLKDKPETEDNKKEPDKNKPDKKDPVKEKPDKKKDETTRKKEVPKTGDAGNAANLLAMFSLSGVAGVLSFKKRKKR